MFKHLTINNFLSYESTEIEFSEGVNVITGLSQAGKSTILRTLNWIISNRPRGENIIRDGQSDVVVSLFGVNEKGKFSVTRGKGKKDNYYSVIVGDEKEVVFRAFGTEVPDQVQELLNLSDINLQKQHSPYFLVFDSPGQSALYIRGVAKLEEIDKVVSVLSGRIRTVSSKISSIEKEVLEVTSKLDVVNEIDLDRFGNCLSEVEKSEEEKERFEREVSELQSMLDLLSSTEQALVSLERIDFESLDERFRESKKLLGVSRRLFEEIREVDYLIVSLNSLRRQEVVLPDNVDSLLIRPSKLMSEFNDVVYEVEQLNTLLLGVESTKKTIQSTEDELSKFTLEREELLSRLEVCPYCGQKLVGNAKAHLLENSLCSTG